MIDYVDDQEEYEPKLSDLCIYLTKESTKRIKTRQLDGSHKVTILTYQKAVEYLDTKTGEIITAKEARKLGVIEIDYGLYVMTRKHLLEQLRTEVKHIAGFVLKFRNARRGITPDLNAVLKYYSDLYKKRYNNVTRYKEDLYKSIMVNDSLCHPEFQFTGKNKTTKEHMSESSHAGNVLFYELLRQVATEELEKVSETEVERK